MTEQIEGKLSYVAKTGGIKLDGSTKWHNPDKGIKNTILQSLDAMKQKIGSPVRVHKNDKGYYTAVEIVKDPAAKEQPAQKEKVEEEDVGDVQEENAPQDNPETAQEPEHVCDQSEEEPEHTEAQQEPDNTYLMVAPNEQKHDPEYYQKLVKTPAEIKKIGQMGLTYVSWAEAWDM